MESELSECEYFFDYSIKDSRKRLEPLEYYFFIFYWSAHFHVMQFEDKVVLKLVKP